MRVLSVNVASGRDATGHSVGPNELAAAFAEVEADVVAVQEVDTGQPRSHGVDQPAVLAAALDALDWRSAPTLSGTPGPVEHWSPVDPVVLRGPGDPPTGPHYGVALFSRVPVSRWHVLGLRAGRARLPVPTPGGVIWVPDEPRAAIAAELDGLTVVGTHLSFAPHTATGQLRRIRAWTAGLPGPVVLVGDLNLPGGLPELLGGGSRLVHGPTFPSSDPRLQLDHVLAPPGTTGTDARVRSLAVGDHLAVSVTVRPGR